MSELVSGKLLEAELFDLEERLQMTEPDDENHAVILKQIEIKRLELKNNALVEFKFLTENGLDSLTYLGMLPQEITKRLVNEKDLIVADRAGVLSIGVITSLTTNLDLEPEQIIYAPHQNDALMHAVRRIALQNGRSPLISEVNK